jgi:hypothetical protein
MITDDGDVAMLVIDWDGSVYRNDNGLKKLREMWVVSFDQNVKVMTPIFAEHFSRQNLGVAGIAWMQQDASGKQV